MKNIEIAEIFNKVADILEIKDENRFRIRAYRRVAQNMDGLSEDIEELARQGKLEEIAGVGKDLASKISEYLRTGKMKFYEELKKKVPQAALELMDIPGIGPKTARAFVYKLKVKGVEDLEKKIRSHRLKALPGIKDKTLDNVLRGIEFLKKGHERTSLGIAYPLAEKIIASLKKLPEVKKCQAAGSLRRMRDTVRDIDILATSTKPKKVMDAFVKLPEVKDILAHGSTKSSVVTKADIQVDVRVVEPSSFGAALLYFTGSKNHNIKLRELAIKKGLKLNEYGLFLEKSNKKIACKEEIDCYKALGLSFIPPQLREDAGEIEQSRKNKIPKLVELGDMKGDLHVHSDQSDGSYSIKDMAEAAMKRNYEYIAITDHSKSLKVAGGLSEKELLKQIEEIRKLNKKYKNFKILAGTEVDISSDGKLDFGNDILKELDFVIAAIHTGFKQSSQVQTTRIIRAMENKYINMIAHLTGRLMGSRDAYEVDMFKILKAARDTGTFLEINAHPLRLDLNDMGARQAKEAGVLAAIDTDAHTTDQFDMMLYGVSVAQRGWLEKRDIINTRPLESFLKLI